MEYRQKIRLFCFPIIEKKLGAFLPVQFFLVEKFSFLTCFPLSFFSTYAQPRISPLLPISHFLSLFGVFQYPPRNERKKGKRKDTRGELIFFFAWKGKKSFASRLFSQHSITLVFPRIFFIKSSFTPEIFEIGRNTHKAAITTNQTSSLNKLLTSYPTP